MLYLIAQIQEKGEKANEKKIRQTGEDLGVMPIFDSLKSSLYRLTEFKILYGQEDSNPNYSFYVEYFRKWIVLEIEESSIRKQLEEMDSDLFQWYRYAEYFVQEKKYLQAQEN